MNTLLYDYSQPSGYVQPYPLVDNRLLNYNLLTFVAESNAATLDVTQDVTQYFINKIVSSVDVTIPVGGNKYIYIAMPKFVGQIDTVVFNNFPVRLVSLGETVFGLEGFDASYYLYRTEFKQNGNNIVISIKNSGLILT